MDTATRLDLEELETREPLELLLKITTGREDGCYLLVEDRGDGRLDVALLSSYRLENFSERQIVRKVRKGEVEVVTEQVIERSELAQWISDHRDY